MGQIGPPTKQGNGPNAGCDVPASGTLPLPAVGTPTVPASGTVQFTKHEQGVFTKHELAKRLASSRNRNVL